MDEAYWRERWRTGRIGFHEGAANEHLRAHVSRLGSAVGPGDAPRRILVPLCGKSEDLAFLRAMGFSVEGVELEESAARAFFDEHGIAWTEAPPVGGAMRALEGGGIRIHVGDFFTFDPAAGALDAAYDRAALVAVRPLDRERYAATMRRLLAPRAPTLLVTVIHDADDLAPPFSVPPEIVRALFANDAPVLLDDVDTLASSESLRARGATSVREQVWLLTASGERA